jgi:hypothetical protein
MGSLNYVRILLGGLVAGVVSFLGDGVVHGLLLRDRWTAILSAFGRNAQEALESPAYTGPYDILKGLAVVWLYAVMRAHFGPGPRTAIIAAIFVWFLCIPVPLFGLLPMKFFGSDFAALWTLFGIFPVLIGALVGCWIYREKL